METEEQERRPGRWNREEGMKVANLLGEKSLIKASTYEGRAKVKVNNVVMEKNMLCSHFFCFSFSLYFVGFVKHCELSRKGISCQGLLESKNLITKKYISNFLPQLGSYPNPTVSAKIWVPESSGRLSHRTL